MTIPKKIISFLWAILAAYATTAIVLFLLAFIMFKFDLDESVAQFAVTFVYILSAAVGALVLGKQMKKNKYIYGACMGLIYVAIIFAISLIAVGNGSILSSNGISTLLLCLCGGLLGGMIS